VRTLRVEREIGDFSADKLREAIPYSERDMPFLL
jgi:hypothetical protein